MGSISPQKVVLQHKLFTSELLSSLFSWQGIRELIKTTQSTDGQHATRS
jgi:hypothetical protein